MREGVVKLLLFQHSLSILSLCGEVEVVVKRVPKLPVSQIPRELVRLVEKWSSKVRLGKCHRDETATNL